MTGQQNTTIRYTAEAWLRQRFVSGEISGRSRDLYQARLVSFIKLHGDRQVDQLTRSDMQAWACTIGHLSHATRRLYLSAVHCFMEWCIAEQITTEDPSDCLPRVREPRRVPRARSKDEIHLLFSVCGNPRDRLVVTLMVQMGLRACEVANADDADVDGRAKTLLVRGKGSNERVLPITEAAWEALVEYRSTLPGAQGPLVRDLRGGRRRLTAAAVALHIGRLLKAAGVKQRGGDGVTAHTLRHTAASDVLDVCGNVRTVQTMLGHSSLATTQIYLRRADLGKLREAMEGRDYRDLEEAV